MADVLEELKNELVTEWDEADEKTKAEINKIYSSMNFKDRKDFKEKSELLHTKYNQTELNLIHMRTEDIHKANAKAADKMIKNLVERVEKKIGKITSTYDVHTNYDNEGFVILNGWFKGEQGACEVESIRAGGYNIQKRHIRVLVK